MANIPKSIPQEDQELISDLLDAKPPKFTDLTKTQYESFDQGALDDENHLLVAETGNGKTFVAEAITKKALENNKNVAYLVPSVALVNDKFETIQSWAPNRKEIRKRSGYTEANVIVATFESYFEAVIRGYAGRFDCVILDDFHEIYSSHRGATIEKGISSALNSSDRKVFALSATLGNPDTLARWMDAKLTISTENRAVPIIETPIEKTDQTYAEQISDIIADNPEKGPFLAFCDTTRNAEARAKGIARTTSFDVPSDINFKQLVQNNISTDLTDKHKKLITLLRNGIAYHHGQMETELKNEIERLAEQGIVKCVTCTTSLSYGFDSPVLSVIVADLKRWDGTRKFIGVFEYVQMIGRAGRDSKRYDEAYAFPLYDDNEQAQERFQFETKVEEKEIEDVESHLKGSTNLRWLLLELINYGWETEAELFEFIQSTLFYSETVQQAPDHIKNNPNITPSDHIHDSVTTELEWLCEQELIEETYSPQGENKTYRATELGNGFVEFEHSNWFPNTIQGLLDLTWWLEQEHEERSLTPERLINKLAGKYYHCEASAKIDHPNISPQMEEHGLYDKPGTTAALICWFWTSGVSVPKMEDLLDLNDLSKLPSTANNLSTALSSLTHLYSPFDMPREPEWIEKLADQVETGISGPDLVLVSNVNHFGRILYNNLTEQINKTGAGSEWDPGEGNYLLPRLKALLNNAGEDITLDVLTDTPKIGPKIGENVLNAISSWDESTEHTQEVPYENSVVRQENIEPSSASETAETTTTPSDPDGQTQNVDLSKSKSESESSTDSENKSSTESEPDGDTKPTSLKDFY